LRKGTIKRYPLFLGRKKRQVAPIKKLYTTPSSSSSSSSSVPVVSADFEIEANFLTTYMQLEEIDRIAIGHQ